MPGERAAEGREEWREGRSEREGGVEGRDELKEGKGRLKGREK